jgi:hypothetical protein
MMTSIATFMRTTIALLFLLLVGFGAPRMEMPLALVAWLLVLLMSYVDLWCLRRMRSATKGTRALLSEAMALVATGSVLATSLALSLLDRGANTGDLLVTGIVAYVVWRGSVVIRHLRAGTEPAHSVSGIEDSRRMIVQLRRSLSRSDRSDA